MTTTRFFKVLHKSGAYINEVWYPPVGEDGDASDSIVPLEMEPGDRVPMWGVEVDEKGNEIGDIPEGALEKMSDSLATTIASRANVDPKAPNDAPDANKGNEGKQTERTGKDVEERKATIVDSLQLLEAGNDQHWTEGGLPQIPVIAEVSGLTGLTRAEITAAAPDFKRPAKSQTA